MPCGLQPFRATSGRKRWRKPGNSWSRSNSAPIQRHSRIASSIRSSSPVTPAPDALTVLIEALDRFAGALETGRADAVLAAEELLAAAVSGVRTADLALISRNPQTR